MGKLEESGRKKTRRKNITKFILGAVAFTGVIGVAVVAPNVVGAMAKLGLLPMGRQREIINRARDRMLKQRLLERTDGKLRLTAKGQRRLVSLTLSEYGATHSRRWDGKWRVLIFDIPEYNKKLREKIRRTLIAIGFIRLQDSVWIFPYDCEDLITLLKTDFETGKKMRYMIVEELEGDKEIRSAFGLH